MARKKKTPDEELNAILSKKELGQAYDQVNIPLLNEHHVLGIIPNWIKEYDNSCEAQIETARGKLLKEFLIEEAQELIEEYKVLIPPKQGEDPTNPKGFRFNPLPMVLGLKDDLTLLSYYQLVIESDESKGLALLSNKKFSQSAIEGRKVIIGRDKANRAKLKKLGNKKDREKTHREMQNKVNSLANEFPYQSWTGISDEAGKSFGVTGRWVRKCTKNPFK